MDDDAFEKGTRGKSLRVFLVNPPLDEPWRTHTDYLREQEEAKERQEMLRTEHRLLIRSHRVNIILAWATVGIALATIALVFVSM
jgi:hypothetical protein